MARHRMRGTESGWLRRIGLGAIAFGFACVLALAHTAASRAGHLGPPAAPPSSAPPTVSAPPPTTPSPAPSSTRPDELVKVSASDVFLLGRKITVPLACQRSGTMSLSRKGHRLGSDRFGCDGVRCARDGQADSSRRPGLARKLATRDALALRAKFDVGRKVLTARLTLRQGDAAKTTRPARRTGLCWINGYLSCGGRYSAPPGIAIKTPGVTASQGYGNFFEFFVNDTNDYNWVNYRLWLFEYGHGWAVLRSVAGLDRPCARDRRPRSPQGPPSVLRLQRLPGWRGRGLLVQRA